MANGIVIGFISVTFAISCAAIIFTGPLSSYFAIGVGVSLLSAAALGLLGAVRSSAPFVIFGPQSSVAAVLALMAQSIGAATAAPELAAQRLPTVRWALAVTTIATGVTLLTLGRMRLDRLLRFIPYPVVAGLLAATGWLIAKSAVTVLTGFPVGVDDIGRVLESRTLAHWVPGALFAMLLLLVVPRSQHHLALPALIAAGFGVAHIAWAMAGLSPAEAAAEGWAFSPVPGNLLEPWDPGLSGDVHWTSLAGVLPAFFTVQAIVLVNLLLNAAGIEVGTRWDVDANRELRATGSANLLAGLLGGIGGYHAPSVTILNYRAGSRGPTAGITAALLCAGVPLLGGSVLAYLPRPVLGGVILFVGVSLILPWVYEGWARFTRGDYAVVLSVVVAGALFGFLTSVAIALVLASLLFVLAASHSHPVRHALSGATHRSRVERRLPEEAVLGEHGDIIHVVVLQGHLFFGNASALTDGIKERLSSPELPAVRFLLLDFRLVTGFDSSAAMCLERLQPDAQLQNFVIGLAGAQERVLDQLRRTGMLSRPGPVCVFPDLDRALEWCEERVLTEIPATAASPVDWLQPFTAFGHEVTVSPDEVVFRRGDRADGVYYLVSGQVSALPHAQREGERVATIRPGTVFGEAGVFSGIVRSATVVADRASTLCRLSIEDLDRMEREDPLLAATFHRFVLRVLAQRLDRTNREVENLLDGLVDGSPR